MKITENKLALMAGLVPILLFLVGFLLVDLANGTELRTVISADATMSEFNPNLNDGSATTGIWGDNTGVEEYNPWLKASLSGISGTIDSVFLKVWFTSTYSNAEVTCSLWMSLRNATETGITWNKFDGTGDWTTGGAQSTGNDRDSVMIVFATTCGWGGACYMTAKFNATGRRVFQAWLDATLSNYGMVGRGVGAKKEFHSRTGTNPDSVIFHYTAAAADVYSGKFPRGIGRGIGR